MKKRIVAALMAALLALQGVGACAESLSADENQDMAKVQSVESQDILEPAEMQDVEIPDIPEGSADTGNAESPAEADIEIVSVEEVTSAEPDPDPETGSTENDSSGSDSVQLPEENDGICLPDETGIVLPEGSEEITDAGIAEGIMDADIAEEVTDADVAEEIADTGITEESDGQNTEVESETDPEALIEENVFAEAAAEGGVSQEISLYAMSESAWKYISIPSGYLQSYDLGGKSGKVTSGESVVIENSVVKPAFETWYCYLDSKGVIVKNSSSSGNPGEYIVKELVTGDSEVTLDDGTKLLFHVEDYALVYSRSVMDQYLAEKITAGMTDYQKAELCCKFVAGYDYGTGSSSSAGMIITGSGDCWASTDALLYMLKKLGIACQSHNGSFAPGAGVGHENVLAKLDGMNYILDAGFEGKAPRFYSMTKVGMTPFSYEVVSKTENTVKITGYADLEKQSQVEIPSEIEGYTVAEIGDGAFSDKDSLVHVTIPDTVEKIGERAFEKCDVLETVTLSKNLKSIGRGSFFLCEALREIQIPASVTEISPDCFYYCKSLEKIEVNPGNAAFSSIDGVMFDKGKTKLLAFPAAKRPDSYTVPASVQAIGNFAFNNGAIKSLNLPAGLKEIGAYAFDNYGLKKIGTDAYTDAELDPLVLPSGMTSISSYAFESAVIGEIVLPASMRRIENYAFFQARIRRINFPEGLEYIGEGAFAGMGFFPRTFLIPASVKQIGSYAFHLAYGWQSMDGGSISGDKNTTTIAFEEGCSAQIGELAFSASKLLVSENSTAHQYAQANGIPFEVKSPGQMYEAALSLKLSNEKDGIALSWNRVGEVSQYEIYRKKPGESSFAQAAVTQQTAWKDADVGKTGEYVYRFESAVGGRRITLAQVSFWRLPAPETVKEEYDREMISVLWSPVEGADEYYVYYLQKGDTEPIKYTRGNEPALGYGGFLDFFVGIEEEDFYVWITAVKNGNEGMPTEVREIKSSANAPADTPVKAPTGLKAKNVSAGIKVSWNSVGDADGYYIYRKTGNGDYKKIATIEKKSTVSYTDKTAKKKNGTVYTYMIRAYRAGKAGQNANRKIVRLTAPSISKLKNTSKKLQVTWKKNAKADGYQIQYAVSSSFKNASSKKISSAKTTKKDIKNPKKKKTYYVRIRSYKKNGGVTYYSAWSAAKKIKIKK